MNSLTGFGIPFILEQQKTKEERIEEARRSGLIGKHGDQDFAGATHGQEFICKQCGSRNIAVGFPVVKDDEKGIEIPYFCRNCGYEGTRVGRVKHLSDDGTLSVDLIPDGLVGVKGYGSLI